jgi:alkanesulfonate monooxygenase SsuD/methylene tetrahydromethanopterin reductase-like flavin-dependent oxidoreductase (luciferase family)
MTSSGTRMQPFEMSWPTWSGRLVPSQGQLAGPAGERKTLRLVAQYADESNLTCPPAEIPRKLDALASHCERLGRDRREITVSAQRTTCIAPTHEQAEAAMSRFVGERGLDFDDPGVRQMIESAVVFGDPDEVGENMSSVLALGVDGLTCNLAANGHEPENVELLGETLTKVMQG